jgi:hypothetical protein
MFGLGPPAVSAANLGQICLFSLFKGGLPPPLGPPRCISRRFRPNHDSPDMWACFGKNPEIFEKSGNCRDFPGFGTQEKLNFNGNEMSSPKSSFKHDGASVRHGESRVRAKKFLYQALIAISGGSVLRVILTEKSIFVVKYGSDGKNFRGKICSQSKAVSDRSGRFSVLCTT